MEPDSKAVALCARYDAAYTERSTWDSLAQDLANYVMPRKAHITDLEQYPSTDKVSQLWDSTAIMANQILAQGQMSFLSPHDDLWFKFQPPYQLKDSDKAKEWFNRVSEITFEELALSNFYTEVHEMYLQRSGLGTCAMFQSVLDDQLYFRTYEFGTYSIVEDPNGFVNELHHCRMVCAEDLIKMFPDAKERLPQQIQALLGTPAGLSKDIELVHMVYPRDPEEMGPEIEGPAGMGMPFASVYLLKKPKMILHESGFQQFPFMVSRYLRWSSSLKGPYGWCPTLSALPDIRQVNLMQKYMDVLAEVAAFPRVLQPSDLDGEIDLRAGGITQFNPYSQNALPKEWATSGRYDIGKDRIEMRQKAINDHFHVDLFKLFGTLDRGAQMSILEVQERSGEALAQFSPTFTRLIHEGFNPMLQRTFELLFQLGKYPDPPDELVQTSPSGDSFLPNPRLRYTSKLALAVEQIQNVGVLKTIEAFAPLIQIKPDIMDNFEDEMVRGFARNNQVPEEWIRPEAEVEEIRAMRAQAMMERMELENEQLRNQGGGNAGPR
jgi:hypothetical protein